MRSDDLTREQARALKNKLHSMLGYLNRLRRRIVYRGFLPSDPLQIAVDRALDSMHRLHVEDRHLTCADVTGGAAGRF